MEFDSSQILQLLFYLATLGTLIHAVILGYHWYSFGANPQASFIGTAVFVVGDIVILLSLAFLVFIL